MSKPLEPASLMTVDDVAAFTAMSSRSVRRMSQAGLMPAPVKIGRRSTRWRRADLVEWMAAGCPPVGKGDEPIEA